MKHSVNLIRHYPGDLLFNLFSLSKNIKQNVFMKCDRGVCHSSKTFKANIPADKVAQIWCYIFLILSCFLFLLPEFIKTVSKDRGGEGELLMKGTLLTWNQREIFFPSSLSKCSKVKYRRKRQVHKSVKEHYTFKKLSMLIKPINYVIFVLWLAESERASTVQWFNLHLSKLIIYNGTIVA